MIHRSLALAAALCLAASLCQAAGLKFIRIPADPGGPEITGTMWSPCAEAPTTMRIGALILAATPDCPIMGKDLPLIVISHGYGGDSLGHRDTAQALADGGFIVVAINHPHANYADMSQANGMGVLVERPADIKRTIDFMLGPSPDAASIGPRRIGFYGFSQGGYTGLVVAGANPDFSKLPPRCADPKVTDCPPADQRRPFQRIQPPRTWTHDPRVKAMVVADPLSTVFLTADSVKDVKIPLQLWGSQLGGGQDAEPENVAKLAHLLPDKPDFRVVPNARHLSFLTPCPSVKSSTKPSCSDAPGFDRTAFHKEFNAEVLAFFREHLMDPRQP
ncbi:alpha/beta hydrolase family protein [Rhizobium lusitanum]|nr:dienelactone hydrolase [Rhizobium lusitanum]